MFRLGGKPFSMIVWTNKYFLFFSEIAVTWWMAMITWATVMVLLKKIPTIVTPAAPLPIAAKSLPAQVKSF
jgi:hypothetical protein